MLTSCEICYNRPTQHEVLSHQSGGVRSPMKRPALSHEGMGKPRVSQARLKRVWTFLMVGIFLGMSFSSESIADSELGVGGPNQSSNVVESTSAPLEKPDSQTGPMVPLEEGVIDLVVVKRSPLQQINLSLPDLAPVMLPDPPALLTGHVDYSQGLYNEMDPLAPDIMGPHPLDSMLRGGQSSGYMGDAMGLSPWQGEWDEDTSLSSSLWLLQPGNDQGLSVTRHLMELPELGYSDRRLPPALVRGEKVLFFLLLFANSTNDNIESWSVASNHLKKNFTNPVGRAIEGYKIDDNPFYINYVAHPVDWFLLGVYVKAAGASDKEAFLMTSVLGNIFWEYVAEGSYIAPSGKDLITNFVSSVAGIYVYNKFLHRWIDPIHNKATAWGRRHHIEFKPTFGPSVSGRGATIASTILIRI